jgi:hypothetical protein
VVRDACLDAHVPFFFKQWGGVMKGRAGRTLDGRTWDEMPDVAEADAPPSRSRGLEPRSRVHLPLRA